MSPFRTAGLLAIPMVTFRFREATVCECYRIVRNGYERPLAEAFN